MVVVVVVIKTGRRRKGKEGWFHLVASVPHPPASQASGWPQQKTRACPLVGRADLVPEDTDVDLIWVFFFLGAASYPSSGIGLI